MRKSEKNTSDCGFEKREKFCDLGIERAEDGEYKNLEFGSGNAEFGMIKQRAWGRAHSALKTDL